MPLPTSKKLLFPVQLKTENLPTLTLAIPARNETLNLVDCLNKIQQLNYPKLEVIVLDDQSTDTTSDVIRGYAHSGIRFISGEKPASGWAGKTYALAQLERASSGEFIAFMNVDVRLDPNDLNYLLSVAKEKRLNMLSCRPRHSRDFSLAALMEPLHYFWNTALPFTRRRTPVSNSLWIIKRSTLKYLGGISSQSYKIAPEIGLARRLINSDTYRFYFSKKPLDAKIHDDYHREIDSAIRSSFPVYRQKIYLSILGIIAHCILLTPYLYLAYQVLDFHISIAHVIALLMIIVESILSATYAVHTRKSWWLAPVFWPFQLIQEIIIISVSVFKYKFGHVEWRGRDIKLTVTKPQKTPEYRPAEEYFGDFRLTKDRNKIKKQKRR